MKIMLIDASKNYFDGMEEAKLLSRNLMRINKVDSNLKNTTVLEI